MERREGGGRTRGGGGLPGGRGRGESNRKGDGEKNRDRAGGRRKDKKSPEREKEGRRKARGTTRSASGRPRPGRSWAGTEAGGRDGGPGGKVESEREERAPGPRSQPAASCEPAMPAAGGEAGGSRGGRGGGRGLGERSIPGSRATSRGRAGRPGPRLASCPRPQHPASARAEGPPASPAPARRPPAPPPPAPLPLPRVFTRPRAGTDAAAPRGPASSAACGALGAWGFRADHALRDGQVEAHLPGGPMLGQKVRGQRGDPRTRPPLPASNQGAPTPHDHT